MGQSEGVVSLPKEMREREAENVFEVGTTSGVAILLLVKRPGESPDAIVRYGDIGEYLSRREKWNVLDNSSLATTKWQGITPNAHGDWVNQRSEDFLSLRPLAVREGEVAASAPVFLSQSLGLTSNRDAWVWNSSERRLRHNVRRTVEFYHKTVDEFAKLGVSGSLKKRVGRAKEFVGRTPREFHWERETYGNLANAKEFTFDENAFTAATYRPFFKQRLYFNSDLISMPRKFPTIYPSTSTENIGIAVTLPGVSTPFSALVTDSIADCHLTGDTEYFPRWRYQPREEALGSSDVLEQVSNINLAALAGYREHYGHQSISEDDLFYHVYGILHS